MKNLKELIAINSSVNKDEVVCYLQKKFQEFAEEILVISNKENQDKSIVVGLNTKLKDIKPIVLSGHIDTVSPDLNLYNTNPFELVIQGDRAYGVGSVDMKSFAAVIMDNCEALKKMNYPLVVVFTTDEETDLICIENVIEKFKELNILPRFTIVGEPTNLEIQNRANGCFEYQVEVLGKSCHASIIDQGVNAINIMARIITFIEDEQKEFASLTSNCGVVDGGDVVNRVPGICKLKFDIRGENSVEIDEFLNKIKLKINQIENCYPGSKIILKNTLKIPPLQEENSPLINALANKFNLSISKFSGGCEAGYYQALSGSAILFGVGDMALAHKPNEYVNIVEYKKYSNTLISLISAMIKAF